MQHSIDIATAQAKSPQAAVAAQDGTDGRTDARQFHSPAHLSLQGGPKNGATYFCQILTDLKIVFTGRFLGKFAVNGY